LHAQDFKFMMSASLFLFYLAIFGQNNTMHSNKTFLPLYTAYNGVVYYL